MLLIAPEVIDEFTTQRSIGYPIGGGQNLQGFTLIFLEAWITGQRLQSQLILLLHPVESPFALNLLQPEQ